MIICGIVYYLHTDQEIDEQREREIWRNMWVKSVGDADLCCLYLLPDEKKSERDGGGGCVCTRVLKKYLSIIW